MEKCILRHVKTNVNSGKCKIRTNMSIGNFLKKLASVSKRTRVYLILRTTYIYWGLKSAKPQDTFDIIVLICYTTISYVKYIQ